jgi:replicative DNA helicase
VAIFSLEMAMDQLIGRMLCAWGRVDFMHLRHNKIPDEDWEGLKFAADALSKAEIYIDDTPALTVMELRARARRLEREKKIKLLVIDYLQLMRGTSRKADSSREQEISEISRGLKALAKELDIPIIALAQVNRDVEKRSDKRPMLSDLRESGAIEQDADLIMFIHRDAAYLKHDMRPARDIAEITVAKHRNGATGMVELMYTSAYTQFEEYVPSHHPSPAI